MNTLAAIGLGLLAVFWARPAFAFVFLRARHEASTEDPLIYVLLAHRTIPSIFLASAAIAGAWLLVWVAVAIAVLTAVSVEIARRRWPERWDTMGHVVSPGAERVGPD